MSVSPSITVIFPNPTTVPAVAMQRRQQVSAAIGRKGAENSDFESLRLLRIGGAAPPTTIRNLLRCPPHIHRRSSGGKQFALPQNRREPNPGVGFGTPRLNPQPNPQLSGDHAPRRTLKHGHVGHQSGSAAARCFRTSAPPARGREETGSPIPKPRILPAHSFSKSHWLTNRRSRLGGRYNGEE